MEPLQNGHVLKFVAKGRTFNPNVGIRTFPRQTYGLSEQSPDEFKNKHSLAAEHGYIYQHQHKPKFEYPSQRHFFDVHRCSHQGSPQEQQNNYLSNSVAFHRKKGRLSEFMDKNGWMSEVIPMMGFERGQTARAFSNRDRQTRINSLKLKPTYDNPTAKKPNVSPEYSNTISVIMAQKLRLRHKRQELAFKQVPSPAREVPESHYDPILAEHVQEKMNKTNMDFYSTCSTFYPRGATRNNQSREVGTRTTNRLERANSEKKRKEISLKFRTMSPDKQRGGSPSKFVRTKAQLQPESLNLQEWYRNTCHSKWVYNPKKLDSEQHQQEAKLYQSINF